MTKKTRNFLTRSAAGVVALVLVVFGVKQCNDKENAQANEEKAVEYARVIKELNEDMRTRCFDAQNEVDSLHNEIDIRDIVIGEMIKDLEDCKNSKKPKVVAKRTKRTSGVAKKSVKTRGVAVVSKSDTTKACVKFDEGACNNTVNINNGTINNYYAPVDTVKKVQECQKRHIIRVYGDRRVLCH